MLKRKLEISKVSYPMTGDVTLSTATRVLPRDITERDKIFFCRLDWERKVFEVKPILQNGNNNFFDS